MELIRRNIIPCEQGAIRAVRYNADGTYCLTCGADKKIKLWNPLTGTLLETLGGHTDEVMDADGSCDNCFLASASVDKSIIYWDVATGQAIRQLQGHDGTVKCVKFNDDYSLAVSGSTDHLVLCWDIRMRKLDPVQTLHDAKDCVTSLVVAGQNVITGSLDGSIRQYDLREGEVRCDKIGVPITHIVQTADGERILAAGLDSTIRLIDKNTGEVLHEYKGHEAEDYLIECGVIQSDSNVVSGSAEGYAVVWNLPNGTQIRKLQMHSGVVPSLAPHPTENDVLFARQGQIELWGNPSESESESEEDMSD